MTRNYLRARLALTQYVEDLVDFNDNLITYLKKRISYSKFRKSNHFQIEYYSISSDAMVSQSDDYELIEDDWIPINLLIIVHHTDEQGSVTLNFGRNKYIFQSREECEDCIMEGIAWPLWTENLEAHTPDGYDPDYNYFADDEPEEEEVQQEEEVKSKSK